MISLTLFSTSNNQSLGSPIPNSNCMHSRILCIGCDQFNHSLCVRYRSISQQEYLLSISFNRLLL